MCISRHRFSCTSMTFTRTRHSVITSTFNAVRCATVFGLLCSLIWTTAAFGAPPTGEVSGYEVFGNTLIPVSKIQELLAPYTGQQSLEGITDASNALQNLYIQAGYAGVVTSVLFRATTASATQTSRQAFPA